MNMKEKVKEMILSFLDPNRSAWMFIVGTAALTVVITVIYDSIKEASGMIGVWILAAALTVIAVSIIVLKTLRRIEVGRVGISEGLKPEPRTGLILLVSGTKATAPAAIEYHMNAKTLRVLWLVASSETMSVAETLAREYRRRISEIRWGEEYRVDPDRVEDTYNIVTRILQKEVATYKFEQRQIIADITGGLKPMTAGMTLACLARNQDMQYMMAVRGPNGEPDRTVPAEPVKIDTTFMPVALRLE
jgi:hypothetical protein